MTPKDRKKKKTGKKRQQWPQHVLEFRNGERLFRTQGTHKLAGQGEGKKSKVEVALYTKNVEGEGRGGMR